MTTASRSLTTAPWEARSLAACFPELHHYLGRDLTHTTGSRPLRRKGIPAESFDLQATRRTRARLTHFALDAQVPGTSHVAIRWEVLLTSKEANMATTVTSE